MLADAAVCEWTTWGLLYAIMGPRSAVPPQLGVRPLPQSLSADMRDGVFSCSLWTRAFSRGLSVMERVLNWGQWMDTASLTRMYRGVQYVHRLEGWLLRHWSRRRADVLGRPGPTQPSCRSCGVAISAKIAVSGSTAPSLLSDGSRGGPPSNGDEALAPPPDPPRAAPSLTCQRSGVKLHGRKRVEKSGERRYSTRLM